MESWKRRETTYLIFSVIGHTASRKTVIIEVRNKNTMRLGGIKWHGPWRQYCFYPENCDVILNSTCLEDITDTIKSLMDARKHGGR